MPTWLTHQTRGDLKEVNLQQNICNLMLLVVIYLIAYMYALDIARFGKSVEIIGLYLQMWICNFSFSEPFSLYQLFFFLHQILLILLTQLCFVSNYPLYYIYSWMFRLSKFVPNVLYSVILWVFVFIMDVIEILQLVLWEYFKLENELCHIARLLPHFLQYLFQWDELISPWDTRADS